jgi:caspase domain-containing protein
VTGLQLVPSARPNGVAMPRIHRLIVGLLVLVPLAVGVASTVAHAEKRIALVIGNAGYQAGALNTPANDAGLIAQTLQAAGFDVVGARDLDQDSLRRALRDFLDKAGGAGPEKNLTSPTNTRVRASWGVTRNLATPNIA